MTAPAATPSRRGLTGPERALVLKPLDSAWTVLLIDPPGVRVLGWIARWPAVTPLQLTVAAQLLGVVAAVAFAADLLVLGAVVFEVRFFVDCLDGKLARLRGQGSRLGAVLDAHGDRVVVTAAFVGLAVAVGQPWVAVALATAYLLAYAFRDLRDALYAEAGLDKPIDALSLGGVAGWLRRRRIYPTLTTIEVEHVTLFVVPLLAGWLDLTVAALALATAYFTLQAARFAAGSLRAAAVLDGGPSTEAVDR
jgi:phosphatidylglycerophosphate synthase